MKISLTFTDGRQLGDTRTLDLSSPALVGRSSHAQLKLDDPSHKTSGRHFEIRAADSGAEALCLGQAGMKVGGRSLASGETAALSKGTLIELPDGAKLRVDAVLAGDGADETVLMSDEKLTETSASRQGATGSTVFPTAATAFGEAKGATAATAFGELKGATAATAYLSGATAAARYGAALHSAGYMLLVSRSGASKKAIVQAFVAEAEKVLPQGFAGGSGEDIRRALVIWITMGLSDGRFSGIERTCVEAFCAQVAEIMKKRRNSRRERLWLGLWPRSMADDAGKIGLAKGPEAAPETTWMARAEELAASGDLAAIRRFVARG